MVEKKSIEQFSLPKSQKTDVKCNSLRLTLAWVQLAKLIGYQENPVHKVYFLVFFCSANKQKQFLGMPYKRY